MTGDQIASLLYLVLLGTAIAGYFVVQNRSRMGTALRHAALWGLIFLGTIAAIGLWDDVRRQVPGQAAVIAEDRIEVPRGRDGHYHMTLQVNGVPVNFIVDTGASEIVLTREDAARAGIDVQNLAFFGRAQTANGTVPTARVFLDEVRLGDMADRGVPASVNGGEMFGSLLGMSYLSRFDRIEIADGRLVLER